MAGELKGDSPFFPGKPVSVEAFVGREKEIEYIFQRGVGQTARGRLTAFFVQGEYGIGKTSIALYTQKAAELNHGLLGLYTPLGGVQSLTDLAAHLLEATIKSGVYDPTWREHIQGWLGKYIGKQNLFGFTVNLEALKQEAPKLASPTQILTFLEQVHERYTRTRNGKGVFWVLDEINGIASQPFFAQFLKSLIDTNAFSKASLPLLLMLCGVEERRRELIRVHQPTDRLFDVVDIHPLSQAEMEQFYTTAFEEVGVRVTAEAMQWMTKAAAGSPKLMHLVGDKVFWKMPPSARELDHLTATLGVLDAAETVGRTLVDGAVYEALQSKDYKAILSKIGKRLGSVLAPVEFSRRELAADLTTAEQRKLGNFLQRMKKLNVIKAGEVRGTYVFRVQMVQMYIVLRSLRDEKR
jgi:hypothetical protein